MIRNTVADFFLTLTQASTLTTGFNSFAYSTAGGRIVITFTGSVTVTDLTPGPACPEDPDKVLTRAVDPEGNDAGLITGLPTHLTLQAAVDQALDGEVIGVFGRSTENVVISAAKGLTITQCTGAQLTAATAGPVVDITSSEPITIIGLDTVGGTIGWRVGTDGHDLKGVRATGASQVGILVVGHDNHVSYNAVRQSAVGIRVEGSGITVRDNRVRGNTLNGLLVTGNQNSLRSNLAQGNTQDGLALLGTSNTLQDNKANQNGGDGFDIRGPGTILRGNASNQGSAGGSSENTGAEFNLDAAAINQGGNTADSICVPKTTAPVKCPTFPAAGLCE